MADAPVSLPAIPEGEVKDPAAAKRFMSKLMNTLVRAHITDGRIITGQLWCFDQLKNTILLNGHETRVLESGEQQHRPLGPLVMVPGKHILKFEASKSASEAAIAASSEEQDREQA
eukprot:TRINITY_DN31450_c0_g1_i1.p1 TRINITY_DN31450_c0_g1~~TRINITY_DN31450_c0_g1_i1.p1  ORF type:complete len:116 (+),score=18.32 TRINITY_DN31450_c0_g1_i1:48-395(+)